MVGSLHGRPDVGLLFCLKICKMHSCTVPYEVNEISMKEDHDHVSSVTAKTENTTHTEGI